MLVDFRALLPANRARFLGCLCGSGKKVTQRYGRKILRIQSSRIGGERGPTLTRPDFGIFVQKSVQNGLDFTRNKECTGSPQPLMLETREKRQIASLVRGDLEVTSTTHFEHELMEIEIAQMGEKMHALDLHNP